MLTALVEEWDVDLASGDPLTFPGYRAKLDGLDHESVRTGLADLSGTRIVLIEGDFEVIGGSMGLVHGEKVVRAFDRATDARLPVLVVTQSGGARMQEGMVALVQMARTVAAARRHAAAGLLSVAVHRSPTTGGVLASYGSLADLRVVEAGATVGFAGPRVVEQTTGEEVANRSHSAETAFDAGLVDDMVVGDDAALAWVRGVLGIDETPLVVADPPGGPAPEPAAEPNSAWHAVLAARHPGRPSGIHVAAAASTSWIELGVGTDPALRTAIATVGGHRTVVVACDRYAGSGRPSPAGFRLAQRGIHLAGRLGLPVVTFVDTPGAEPGSSAENDGIAVEIARTFAAMAEVPTATISVCVGEGGSGGALALAAADRLLLQDEAVFSVIGPEGAAAILERDASRAPQVAPLLRLTSTDLVDLGIVDRTVPDDIDDTIAAVHHELDEVAGGQAAWVGQGRLRRFDAATDRWLRTTPTSP